MSESNKEIIEQVLKNGSDEIEFEPIPNENDSPLAQPVVKKQNTAEDVKVSKEETVSQDKKEEPKTETTPGEEKEKTGGEAGTGAEEETKEEETDAPEQEVDADAEEGAEEGEDGPVGEEFVLPLEQATLLANTILGVANNVLEVGGGFFITIKKHKDFYDFDEVIQIIDEQNSKNVKRLKLDAEDKALLRPLLIHVLRKKTKVLTPEQQLLGAALSIIIKKAKIVLEIRKDNEIMLDRIRDVIRNEMQKYVVKPVEKNETENKQEMKTESKSETANQEEEEEEEEEYEEVIEEPIKEEQKFTGMPNTILEKFD